MNLTAATKQSPAAASASSTHWRIKSGLIDEIDERLELLKRHLPYHESDHVLNIAYNLLAGGSCLEDIELLRNDEARLNALGADIIPDPTTS